MFSRLKKLLGGKPTPNNIVQQIEDIAKETIANLDLDNPAERVGVRLYFVLKKQFDLIGKPDGEFPYVHPFASAKARGALLGTAIGVVRQQYGEMPHEAVTDAAITAFVLAFGKENGRFYALQTIKEAADGDNDVNFASDWAIKDTDGPNVNDGLATPLAFYLAVDEMI